jgi:transposase-like protein
MINWPSAEKHAIDCPYCGHNVLRTVKTVELKEESVNISNAEVQGYRCGSCDGLFFTPLTTLFKYHIVGEKSGQKREIPRDVVRELNRRGMTPGCDILDEMIKLMSRGLNAS